ncbi:MAG: hypothetical protein Q7W51_03065 [Coriobacteriia bacterium]|nr:hypothetical protein [Coriobacteriia bacterium]
MAIIFRPGGTVAQGATSESYDSAKPPEPVPVSAVGSIVALLAAAGVAASITMLYLGMGTIMETSGAFVASGGPYEIVSPAPDWVWLIPVSIWTMLIFGGLALFATKRGWGESPLLYGWMGLFIPLGWNFLRLGLNPPEFMASTWGWIVSGIVFWIMGLVPVGFVVSRAIDAFKDARAGNPQSTISGRPTRGIYLALQVVGVAVGIIAGNALFTAVTGV